MTHLLLISMATKFCLNPYCLCIICICMRLVWVSWLGRKKKKRGRWAHMASLSSCFCCLIFGWSSTWILVFLYLWVGKWFSMIVVILLVVVIIVVIVEVVYCHGKMSQKLTCVRYTNWFDFSCWFCLIVLESKKVACEDCVCGVMERWEIELVNSWIVLDPSDRFENSIEVFQYENENHILLKRS